MTQKIKLKSNNMEVTAEVCDRTSIASVKMFGVVYKFSKHEYEVIEE